MDHVLSELSTMTHPSWVALHSMADSYIELDTAVVHIISLISLIIFFAAEIGEALYSQQKQDWELTVDQIMNSLLQSSNNWP